MKRKTAEILLAAAVVLGLVICLFWPLVHCPSECTLDLAAVHGEPLGHFELIDVKLNMWILAWAQHALVEQPLHFFDANAFYPAPETLAGSEHMLGVALLTWPLRFFTDDAVLIYHLTLIFSSLLLGFTTYALVRWLTASSWAALAAAAASLFMPWRIAELTHLQLLSAHWFPLIWLLTLKILVEEADRRTALLLAAVLTFQLLGSFYLAYFLTASLAVILFTASCLRETSPARLLRFAACAAIPYLVLVVTSLPYLAREGRGELAMLNSPVVVSRLDDLGRTLLLVAPRLEALWAGGFAAVPAYYTPPSVFALAVLTLAGSRLGSSPHSLRGVRERVAIPALWICVGVALLLAFGSRLQIGDGSLALPGEWASRIIPGFSKIRAPHRWNILTGLALPVLAGIGLARLQARSALWLEGSRMNRVIVPAGIVIAFTLLLPLRSLPVSRNWSPLRADAGLYEALRALPAGPVLEIPWPVDSLPRMGTDANYLLASTLHWRPILNGVTGYAPESYRMLNQIAHRLPGESSLERLRRLVDIRWIVVHTPNAPARRALWLKAGPQRGLSLRHEGARGLIFELSPDEQTGRWMRGIRSAKAREETLSGIPRTALARHRATGRLEVTLPTKLVELMPARMQARITNQSAAPWPGLEYQTDGTLHIRYIFSDSQGRTVMAGLQHTNDDVLPGEGLEVEAQILTPSLAGSYLFCADLVQPFGDEMRALPVAPVALRVRVHEHPDPSRHSPTDVRNRLLQSMPLAGWNSPCLAKTPNP